MRRLHTSAATFISCQKGKSQRQELTVAASRNQRSAAHDVGPPVSVISVSAKRLLTYQSSAGGTSRSGILLAETAGHGQFAGCTPQIQVHSAFTIVRELL